MTSGNFSTVPVNSITIDRENRQRREIKDIDELAESIKRNGLINPIVITRDGLLVAGERRLTAHKQLGFDHITVHYAEDMPEAELKILELEENVRRKDLPWQDMVRSVAEFVDIKKEENPEWTAEDTAESLNISRTNVGRYLMVNKFLEDDVREVAEAAKLSSAVNFAQRAMERRNTDTLRDLLPDAAPVSAPMTGATEGPAPLTPETSVTPATPAPVARHAAIENTDFIKWADTIQERPFNLVHCDFPYGVNAGDTKGQTGSKQYGGYKDTADTYFNLVSAFLEKQDNFIAPSAHLIFWFSMDYIHETKELLKGGGWVVNPFPLVWFKSDNTGVIPDANRGPRRVYETALMATRGDRKIVRAVGNCFPHGVNKEFHLSEKPKAMLEHFMRMLVDETTRMLDPTCGSGNAVAVSERLGARQSLGLELNPEYAEKAKMNLGL